jgi:hypothetical protein
MTAAELVRTATREFKQLTGVAPERVSGLDRDDDTWIVTLEALEVSRVPMTMDVLASYQIKLSDGGELLGFHRSGRYQRGSTDNGRH